MSTPLHSEELAGPIALADNRSTCCTGAAGMIVIDYPEEGRQ